MKRVTNRNLMKLVNQALTRLEMGYTCIKVERSRFRSQDYECGAWHWRAVLEKENEADRHELIKPFIFSFLPFSEFEGCITGKDILTFKKMSRGSGYSLSDYEIWPNSN